MSISNFTRKVMFLFLRTPYSFQLLHMRTSSLTCHFPILQTSSSEGWQTPLTVLQALPQGVFFLKEVSLICSPSSCMFSLAPHVHDLLPNLLFHSQPCPMPKGAPVCTGHTQCWLRFCTLYQWVVPKAPGPHPSVTTECPQWQPHPAPKPHGLRKQGSVFYPSSPPVCLPCLHMVSSHLITTPSALTAFNNSTLYFPSALPCHQ